MYKKKHAFVVGFMSHTGIQHDIKDTIRMSVIHIPAVRLVLAKDSKEARFKFKVWYAFFYPERFLEITTIVKLRHASNTRYATAVAGGGGITYVNYHLHTAYSPITWLGSAANRWVSTGIGAVRLAFLIKNRVRVPIKHTRKSWKQYC